MLSLSPSRGRDKNAENSQLPLNAFSLEATLITSVHGPVVLTKTAHGLFGDEDLLPWALRKGAFRDEELAGAKTGKNENAGRAMGRTNRSRTQQAWDVIS